MCKPSALGCECRLPLCSVWDGEKKRPVIDLSMISHAWQINNIKWEDFCDEENKGWVSHIKYPVSQRDLSLMSTLSLVPGVLYNFGNSAGELFYGKKTLEQINKCNCGKKTE